jgi:hypothetical protein
MLAGSNNNCLIATDKFDIAVISDNLNEQTLPNRKGNDGSGSKSYVKSVSFVS